MMTNNSRGDSTFACQIMMAAGLSGRTAASRNNGGLS